MKKLIAAALCFLACELCLFSACDGGGTFVFISVRMKGNGDGTVTCVAQNEFSLSGTEMPVRLYLYASESAETNTDNMSLIKTAEGNLKFSQKVSFDCKLQAEGYYLAKIEYTVENQTRYLQSDVIRYDINGVRK